MKKYKLIKEYPGSPKVGDIVKGYGTDSWSEFWEEVVEKDYEILSFKQDSGIADLWTKFHTNSWGRNVNGQCVTNPYTTEEILSNKLYAIHSVKRLSDGEVFTLGDKAKTVDTNGRHTIRQFRIKQKCFGKNFSGNYTYDGIDRIWIDWEENCGGNWLESTEKVIEKDYQILKSCPIEGTIYSVERLSDGEVFTLGDRIKVYQHGSMETITEIIINVNPLVKEGIWLRYNTGSCHMTHVIKQKQQIYLTLNGKDIFKGDIVWYVNKENFYHDYIKAYPEVKFNSDIRAYFLTEEEAKKYIIENKPALSIKEFWEITTMSGSNRVKSIVLKELAKKRLNLK